MKFAVVDGQRVEPTPRANGICYSCSAEMVAKCGKFKVWHWAHKSRQSCDPWWEAETEWHREWKNRFPVEWQEIVLFDQSTGERHIADVRTPGGLVIEFQHSSIDPIEVEVRQNFYGKMIWVVDGCRNELDKSHFMLGLGKRNEHGIAGFRWWGSGKLFARWHSTKPVFIDFGPTYGFWRVLRYDLKTKTGKIGIVSILGFVEAASTGQTDFSSVGGPATKD